MPFTERQARDRLRALGQARVEAAMHEAADGAPDFISGSLILAISLRESGIKNIVGDLGHGRGHLQIDDRSHAEFLASHAGCKSGSWAFTFSHKQGGALVRGRVPGQIAATRYAIQLLLGNAAFAKANGVPEKHRKQFAIAAYNCGAGNAIRSYREGGIRAIDRRTAGGDYSKDVLANQEAVRAALKNLDW